MAVKFFLDECVTQNSTVAEQLTQKCIYVETIASIGQGATDPSVFHYVINYKLTLVTMDDDFFDLFQEHLNSGQHHYGLIFIEQKRLTLGEIIRKLIKIDQEYDSITIIDQYFY